MRAAHQSVYCACLFFQVSSFIRKQEVEEGIATTDEASHNALVADIFLHEDYDKDGYISHTEFSGPKHEEL